MIFQVSPTLEFLAGLTPAVEQVPAADYVPVKVLGDVFRIIFHF